MDDLRTKPADSCSADVPRQNDRLLDDCWFIEVMPPTWAWGYRRLFETGAAERPRLTKRIA